MASLNHGNAECSWSLLTMHKAASSFVGEFLKNIFTENGYSVADLAAEAFRTGVNESSFIENNIENYLVGRSFLGPFRTESAPLAADIPDIRPIVHVRDPRDCLVSMYYSLAYSHPLPGEGKIRHKFLLDREMFQKMSVDDFAFEGLRRGYRALNIMRSICEKRADCVLSKYEEMVGDFGGWVRRILRECELEAPKNIDDLIAANGDFRVEEDMHRHKRQVTPGDHRRKLAPSTISVLNERFCEDLKFFGYDA